MRCVSCLIPDLLSKLLTSPLDAQGFKVPAVHLEQVLSLSKQGFPKTGGGYLEGSHTRYQASTK